MMKHRVVVSYALVYEGEKPSLKQVRSDAEIVRRLAEKHTAAASCELRTRGEPTFITGGT